MPDPTTLLLIRHGQTDWIAKGIAGRLPDVHLNAEGRDQAARLAGRCAPLPLAAIYSSPMERALETAAPVADAVGLEVRPCPEAVELDFGEWVGHSIPGLGSDPRWRAFNSYRSFSGAPGGELMPQVQTRIVQAMARIRAAHPGEAVALVSHGDVIRAAVAYCLGVPLDLFLRIEIRPASVSSVRFSDESLLVLGVNDTGELYV
jgi:probable phosphoglycerate mutase